MFYFNPNPNPNHGITYLTTVASLSYGALGHVPPRPATAIFHLTSKPPKVYNISGSLSKTGVLSRLEKALNRFGPLPGPAVVAYDAVSEHWSAGKAVHSWRGGHPLRVQHPRRLWRLRVEASLHAALAPTLAKPLFNFVPWLHVK